MVVPYYASYTTNHACKAAYKAIAGDGETRAVVFLGLAASKVVGPVKFRFCSQCAREDIANHGEAYWRRSFQLPGVVVCPKHRVSLRESSADTRPRSSTEWYAGNALITALLEDDSTGRVLWNGNPHVLEVARQSVDLLVCDTARSFSALSEHYLSLARAAGLTRPSGIVDSDVLSREMRAMYGEDFLNTTGLSESAARKLTWPKLMMVRADASFQPLQHILLSHLLECCPTSMKNRGQPQLIARQKFICPNPYAVHGAGHIVDVVKVKQTAGGRIGSGACVCGLKFSFQRCHVGTAEPEISKVLDYGKDWRKAARAMRRNGKPFSVIAGEMGVSVGSVKVMVGRKHTRDVELTEARILEWRREWERLLERVAPLGHEAVCKLNFRLYQRLQKRDAAWLRESGRRHRQKPRARQLQGKVDWAARDKAWSEALRTAAENLYASASRSRRVSIAAIISAAGAYQIDYDKLNRLPMCRAALEASAESVEQFGVFRLQRAAQFLFDQGDLVSAYKLLRRAYIPKERMTPLIRATINRLADEFGTRSPRGYQEDPGATDT
ncbi:TnsD family Tn7-like transposition protein [Ralstonia solanacearum]|uniref:TnsD family Tn7-like transposition protein n=1 Tax=Ralstonia solanacearum TaxID=305 RepID=UPI000A62C52D|nr:TnsD family Tn7-like transposition protein [Ralstonia solanacearum]